MDRLRGLDADRVGGWLTESTDLVEPLTFELIAAGGSNLTYRVEDGNGALLALRRPPAGRRLESAHDIDREWRILRALSRNRSVPVPRPVVRCDDDSVTGTPFYAMEFVDGTVYRTAADTASLTMTQATALTASLVETQHALHTVDFDSLGLSDLSRHTGYVERQLRRWRRQLEVGATRDVPVLSLVHDRLVSRIPPERTRPGLVHGDYRLDNTVAGERNRIIGVLDWELCTIGDPLADFVWTLQYWSDPDDPIDFLPDPPDAHATFPRRDDLVEMYHSASGIDLSDLGYYSAFSWWKQASIVEGVYARRLAGSTGGAQSTVDVQAIGRRAETLAAHAETLTHDLD